MIGDRKTLDETLEEVLGGHSDQIRIHSPDHFSIVVDLRKFMRCEEAGRGWQELADPPAPPPPPMMHKCEYCQTDKPITEFLKKPHPTNSLAHAYMCQACKTSVWEKVK